MAALTFKRLLRRDPRSAARYAHVVAREEWEVTQKWPLLCSAALCGWF
jgi:hypothetical protein